MAHHCCKSYWWLHGKTHTIARYEMHGFCYTPWERSWHGITHTAWFLPWGMGFAMLHDLFHVLPYMTLGKRWIEQKHLQTHDQQKNSTQYIVWNSSLHFWSFSIILALPPATITCWFKLTALRPASLLGKSKSTPDKHGSVYLKLKLCKHLLYENRSAVLMKIICAPLTIWKG